jgi:hypothetical protein
VAVLLRHGARVDACTEAMQPTSGPSSTPSSSPRSGVLSRCTPLHLAARSGDRRTLRLLIAPDCT